ncbi:hypothetical protein JTB14_016388 [Gonioctena quinquepunctata]|nr:hypothetical protein JTB14_016388 [Gonioctena quinquepunctata]
MEFWRNAIIAYIATIYTELLELSALTVEDSGYRRGGDLDRGQLHAPEEIQQQNNLQMNSETIEQNTNPDADGTEPLP